MRSQYRNRGSSMFYKFLFLMDFQQILYIKNFEINYKLVSFLYFDVYFKTTYLF